METSAPVRRDRRAEWTDAATDYVLERGLITLTLRPLAAAIGTSDRMLIYHFGSKDDLVAAVLRSSNDRACGVIRSLARSGGLAAAVRDLWSAMAHRDVGPCNRLYIEAAALGLLGREPYASVAREANAAWRQVLATHFARAGASLPVAQRVASIVDAAMMGFHLDLPPGASGDPKAGAVEDLAAAVVALGDGTPRLAGQGGVNR